jgi:pseudouridine-5'-phosphate glycosidase
MERQLPKSFILSEDVSRALYSRMPIVALESAVITHGLPHPQNLDLAKEMESTVRANGATPATIGVLDGKVHIGLTPAEVETLADLSVPARKISRRDYGIAIARREKGGTTVAGTLIAAHMAGIRVFATGGIGGVHRDAPFDISADLPELGRTPLVVVCAGAKAILDLPATIEYLETMGIPIVGYRTKEFPAFYSPDSGLPVNVSVDSPEEICQIAKAHWDMGQTSAILVVVPPPAEAAEPREEVEGIIQEALKEAQAAGIRGAAVTPFLLSKVSQLSGGASLRANLALLKNNASVAGQIAARMFSNTGWKMV